VDDRAGNGNGLPEPGETAILYVNIENRGKAALDGASVFLTTGDPWVAMADSNVSPPALPPDSTGSYAFQLFIDPDMPGTWSAPVFGLRSRQGWMEWRDSFAVAMGQVGLADDMEAGSPGWQAGGGWHLTTIRSRSPSHSWYFGSEADTLTPQYSVDTLETPAFLAGPACSLVWWHRHGFVPGWSWGVVEVCGDFGARLLEVVDGSSSGWRRSGHDLSRYAPGTVLSLRFIAVCDSVRSEGWYLDDLSVFGPPSGVAGPPTQDGDPSLRFALHPCRPNPSKGRTTIGFCLPHAAEASLKVYNVQGQLVRTLATGSMAAGPHSVGWDGRDDRGRPAAGGVYLYRLRAGTATETGKMVVVK
jgi:hypothetical protein